MNDLPPKGDAWDGLREAVTELFQLHMTQYCVWCDPTRGAVSPALSEFFAWCNPTSEALVHWARWLRLEHESDEGIHTIDPEDAETLVDVMIDAQRVSPSVADVMRRAVRGEPLGERDPNQLNLF